MTPDRYKPLLDRDFLKGELAYDYQDYLANGADAPLLERRAAVLRARVNRPRG